MARPASPTPPLTKINGNIELDPHAVRACVLRFDEHGATVLRDTLTAWLG